MENSAALLDKNESLYQIHHTFEFVRKQAYIFIDVTECIVGKDKGTFIAIPKLTIYEAPKKEYIGCGNSEEEALNDFLKKIKGMPFDQIFEYKFIEGLRRY